MMKNRLFAPHGLALVALSIALAGCPALDTLTLSDPKAEPSPTASAPTGDPGKGDDPKEDPKEPAFAIKALGPVRAQLLGRMEVEHGPFTVQLNYSHDKIFHDLGILGTLQTTAPAGYASRFTPQQGSEELYVLDNEGTHYFSQADAVALVHDGELALTVGGVAPTDVQTVDRGYYGGYFLLTYPPAAQGDLVATPDDSALSFRKPYDNNHTYSFTRTSSLPLANVQGVRSATVSATVAVQELDGTPSTGLTAANFRLSGDGRIAIQATETEAGRYRVVMALDAMNGPQPTPQRRQLTVTHATLTTTHTVSSPSPSPSSSPLERIR